MRQIRDVVKTLTSDARILALWLVMALIVPNLALNITENYYGVMKLVNLALPLGIYLILISLWKRIGVTTILFLPIMLLGAFQLVLLYLYGESIIAVDMFLNVVTTTMSEATELLSNLLIAIFAVVLLYLPLLIWAGIAVFQHIFLPAGFRKGMRLWGIGLALAGLLMSAVNICMDASESFTREIFPVNVVDNMFVARSRYHKTRLYPETSQGFSYGSHPTRPDNGEREIYLYVIGETSRAINWELAGYDRPTNPRLKAIKNLVFFNKAISESNTTHKSVPMLMSFACAENFDSINCYKSIITAMKEAGFYTRFYSNQAPNGSFIQFFGEEADDVNYTDYSAIPHPCDGELVPMVRKALADTIHRKQFIVLHTYGAHFLYNDRYPADRAYFQPDCITDATPAARQVLINAYDNAVRYTDEILATIINDLDATGAKCAMLYSADHGEDIYDDERERFLHASPIPTYYQLHVAMFTWLSDAMAQEHPQFLRSMKANADRCVSPQKSMFNTAIHLAGVSTPRLIPTRSVASRDYAYEKPRYLTDLNVAVPLMESGLKNADKEILSKMIGL